MTHESSDAGVRRIATIVLAAGQGTRMRSDRHKVLHPVAARPMLLHLLASAGRLDPARSVVVTGSRREQIAAAVAPLGSTPQAVTMVDQPEQRGTAHAVLQAEAALADFAGDILILYGDVPLVATQTMRRMLDRLHAPDAPEIVVLGFRPEDPSGYGRIIADPAGRIARMVEHRDATAEERTVTLCNSGLMAVAGERLFAWLKRVGNANAAREYYLPDIVMLALADGGAPVVIEADPAEVAGVNDRVELARVEARWQAARREQAMRDGATLIDPQTVWFAYDTVLGRDVVVEPNVWFGPGVKVADGAVIHAHSHLEGASIGAGAEVGPFARLRPGTILEQGAKIGNFVEVKNAVLGPGAKASHLTYLGDASIGAGANIGAGTITCNYDGFFKYRTSIGDGAFIGSNSALVAPVTIGAGAIVGAGSVVTGDVGADALALARGRQEERPGWARRFREAMTARKAASRREPRDQ